MSRAVIQQHARIGRKIINLDGTSANGNGYGVCAWDECDRDACSLSQARQHEHWWPQHSLLLPDGRMVAPRDVCSAVDAGLIPGRHVWFAFCSERHKQYWVYATGPRAYEQAARNQARTYGNLPEGFRRTIL